MLYLDPVEVHLLNLLRRDDPRVTGLVSWGATGPYLTLLKDLSGPDKKVLS